MQALLRQQQARRELQQKLQELQAHQDFVRALEARGVQKFDGGHAGGGHRHAVGGHRHAVGGHAGGGQHHHHAVGGHAGGGHAGGGQHRHHAVGGHAGGGQHHHHAVGGQGPSLPPHVRGMPNAVGFFWSRRRCAVFLVKLRDGRFTLPGGKRDHRDGDTRVTTGREGWEEGLRGPNGSRVEVTGAPSTWGRPKPHTTYYCGPAPEGLHFEQHWRNTETCDGQWFSWRELNLLAAGGQLRFPEPTLYYAKRLLKH